MALTIDPMGNKNWRRHQREAAKTLPPPRPVRTLADMSAEERAEMERLYARGPQSREVGPR